MKKIYIEVDSNDSVVCFSSGPISDDCIELDITDEEFWELTVNAGKYNYVEGQLIKESFDPLVTERKNKDDELNALCKKAIEDGFSYTHQGVSYTVPLPITAQANLQGAYNLFQSGLVSEMSWTVKNNSTGEYERITVTPSMMNQWAIIMAVHIQTQVGKYRDYLLPLVYSAQTLEDVQAITWF